MNAPVLKYVVVEKESCLLISVNLITLTISLSHPCPFLSLYLIFATVVIHSSLAVLLLLVYARFTNPFHHGLSSFRTTDSTESGSLPLFTARRYASAVLAMALCPSVRLSVSPSVRPSQVGVLLKRLNVGSHKQHHTIAQGL